TSPAPWPSTTEFNSSVVGRRCDGAGERGDRACRRGRRWRRTPCSSVTAVVKVIHSPLWPCTAARVRYVVFPDDESVEVGAQEGVDPVAGAAHDRFLVHVEAGVDQAGNTRQLLVLGDDVVVGGIDGAAYELRAG